MPSASSPWITGMVTLVGIRAAAQMSVTVEINRADVVLEGIIGGDDTLEHIFQVGNDACFVLAQDHCPGSMLKEHHCLAVLHTAAMHKIFHLIGDIHYVEATV